MTNDHPGCGTSWPLDYCINDSITKLCPTMCQIMEPGVKNIKSQNFATTQISMSDAQGTDQIAGPPDPSHPARLGAEYQNSLVKECYAGFGMGISKHLVEQCYAGIGLSI